jgi:hypothetical protein
MEFRPMTRRAVVAAHPGVDTRFLELPSERVEIHALDLPMLERLVLVDCPDPDTQDPADGEGGQRHLEILRAVLAHADVIVHTATSQKYKSHVVAQELLAGAPGRQLLFVQTHARLDPDNRPDFHRFLEEKGLAVPAIYRLDALEALQCQERGEPPPAEFAAFQRTLEASLSDRARFRIRRANVINLAGWVLDQAGRPNREGLPAVERLEAAIADQRATLVSQVRGPLAARIANNRRLWRSRYLRQVTQSWGGGPLAALLSLVASAGAWLRSGLLLRARTLPQAAVAASVALGHYASEKLRERRAEAAWSAESDLGLSRASLAEARSILAGFAADAGVAPAATPGEDPDARLETDLAAVGEAAFRAFDQATTRVLESRAARPVNRVLHVAFEALFLLLPAALVLHLARNFFYEHLWNRQPLLGIEFLVHALFWTALWAALLGWGLSALVTAGLERALRAEVARIDPGALLSEAFGDLAAPAREIRAQAAAFQALENRFARFEAEVGSTADLGLGHLKVGAS